MVRLMPLESVEISVSNPLIRSSFSSLFFRIDGQAVIEITFLAVLGAEHAVYLVHHILDVRDGRSQGRFRLYQLAYRLTEGDNLLGALRGIHVDGVVDLIVLFLSHGNGYCVKRIVFPQGRRL